MKFVKYLIITVIYLILLIGVHMLWGSAVVDAVLTIATVLFVVLGVGEKEDD